MTITTDLGGKNYVLGRGRVFFDRFASGATVTGTTRGEGERYIGNTPEVSTTTSSEKFEHYDSEAGVKTKDLTILLSTNRTGKFTTDNINAANLALFFLGDAATLTQTSATAVVEVISGAKRDRFYQLGVTTALPAGVRAISNVVVKSGAGFTTTIAQATNYEVDEVTGRVYILAGAPGIPDNIALQFTYDVAAGTREQVVSKSQSIYGALRFVSDNPSGANRDIYMPYVQLSPDGDYNLKGDTVQSMGFAIEILKKASNIEAVYLDGRPA